MDPITIKFSAGAWILAVPKYLYNNFKRIRNLYARPKLEIIFKPHCLEIFDDQNKAISNTPIPAIIITPKDKELEIKIRSIKVGAAFFGYLSGGSQNLKEKKHNLKILNYVEQNQLYIKTSKYEPLIIPLPTIGLAYNSYLLSPSQGSLLFFANKKITFAFEANDKIYHYGLDAIKISRVVINHISAQCEVLKSLKDEYKQFIL